MNELYLSAQELGISEQERDALIKTIEVLEAEQIVFNMAVTCDISDDAPAEAYNAPSHPCGTRACIGGTMSLIMQNGGTLPRSITPKMRDRASDFVGRHTCYPSSLNGLMSVDMDRTRFTRLFYDYEGNETPAQGVTAIKLFLRGNKFPWGEAAPDDAD